MMAICLRYTKNETDAVEVLNNGFLRAFKNIHRYQSEKSVFYTWLRTIVVNSCIDFVKLKQKDNHAMELHEAADVSMPPEIIGQMDADELLALVRELPPATQAVFNLYAIEGFNHREIAGMMNISEGTSKWHLSEGRKKLQQMMQQQAIKIHE